MSRTSLFQLHRSFAAGLAIAALGSGPSLAQPPRSSDLPQIEPGSRVGASTPSSNNGVTAIQKPIDSNATASSARFFCQLWRGEYTVMYNPESRPKEVFPWAVPKDLGGGWSAEKRCGEISRRLEEYRPDGLLELKTSTLNGYNIVCATSESNPACRIVFTVPPGMDPILTRDSVFQNLTVADGGTMTQGVNTYASVGGDSLNLTDDLVNIGLSLLGNRSSNVTSFADQNAINLRPHLDPADGGTGTAMYQGVRGQKPLRLNPNRFR